MIANRNEHILYLSRKDVERACKELDSVAIIRQAFQMHGSGQTILPDEAYLAWTNAMGEQVRNLNMPGYVGGVAGTKIINGNINNSTRNLPRASGLTLLYDDTTVQVTCMMESAYISSLRTASVTALATEILSGKEIHCVAIIGAGVLAQAHIELLVKRLPHLHEVRIFDIEPRRISSLQRNLSEVLKAAGVEMIATISAEAAIRSAQLVVPVTTTTTGYIPFEWLQPGSLLVNVSLDDPLPEVVFKAHKVIVDDWNLVKADTRRLLGRMYHQGQLVSPAEAVGAQTQEHYRRVDAQLGDIVTGKSAGRTSESEIILMNPFGLAIEDVALASHIYQVALALEIGVHLER